MKFHKIADFFPMMETEEFDNLVEDIKKNGLIEPIWIYKNQILDGRNRFMACRAAEIEPKYRDYKGDDPMAFAMSLNIERRHLTPSQRACLAVELLPFYRKAIKEKEAARKSGVTQPKMAESSGEARNYAAEVAHVSHGYVGNAMVVQEESPELFEEMKAGLIHMKEAMSEVKKRKKQKARAQKLEEVSVAPVWVGKFETDCIYQADVTKVEFIRQLPEDSVDLIITDPPWDESSLKTYEAAARIAFRTLKPGHFMAIYSGKMFLHQILDILHIAGLEYIWTFSVFQPDSNDKIQKYHLYSAWRPVILVQKPGKRIDMVWMPDSIKSTRDKKYHEWGQGVELVEKLIGGYSQPGDIVLDPFIGGASVPYVAKTQKRRYIGFDISEETVRLGLSRVNETSL